MLQETYSFLWDHEASNLALGLFLDIQAHEREPGTYPGTRCAGGFRQKAQEFERRTNFTMLDFFPNHIFLRAMQ